MNIKVFLILLLICGLNAKTAFSQNLNTAVFDSLKIGDIIQIGAPNVFTSPQHRHQSGSCPSWDSMLLTLTRIDKNTIEVSYTYGDTGIEYFAVFRDTSSYLKSGNKQKQIKESDAALRKFKLKPNTKYASLEFLGELYDAGFGMGYCVSRYARKHIVWEKQYPNEILNVFKGQFNSISLDCEADAKATGKSYCLNNWHRISNSHCEEPTQFMIILHDCYSLDIIKKYLQLK